MDNKICPFASCQQTVKQQCKEENIFELERKNLTFLRALCEICRFMLTKIEDNNTVRNLNDRK